MLKRCNSPGNSQKRFVQWRRNNVIGEKPGAIVPHKRSNPCGTPGFVRGLSGNWQSYRNGCLTLINEIPRRKRTGYRSAK